MIRNQRLTDNFHGSEAFTTLRAVSNAIPASQITEVEGNIRITATRMESIRAILGNKPITINSWYRNAELNKLIGGSVTSDHMTGSAVDFICPSFGTPLDICKELIKGKHAIPFKQLIYEHTWVHISFDFKIPPVAARRQVLTLLSGGKYAIGITDKNGFNL